MKLITMGKLVNNRKISFLQRLLFIGLAICYLPKHADAQFYFFDDVETKIELDFVKPKIELKAKASFFNLLTIINSANKVQKIIVNYTVPQGWNLIGDDVLHLQLNPLDTMRLPVRVALAPLVKGEIGYAVVATVTDEDGNIIKSVQSYITIPRESNIRVKSLTRTNYFDQKSGISKLKLNIENKGNSDEIIYLEIKSDPSISIPGEVSNLLTADVNLGPYSDTLLDYTVMLNPDHDKLKTSFGVEVKAFYQDTSQTRSVWFKKLESSYENYIAESSKPLVVEIGAQNLFSEFKTNYTALIRGNILFKRDRDLYYYYSNTSSNTFEDLYKYNRMWIGYRNKFMDITVGDINVSMGQTIYGRGVNYKLRYKKHSLSMVAAQNQFIDDRSYGFKYDMPAIGPIKLGFAGSYKLNKSANLLTRAASIGGGFNFLKGQNLSAGVQVSDIQSQIGAITPKRGFGYTFGYGLRYSKIQGNALVKLTDKNYVYNQGRFEARGRLSYPIVNKNRLYLFYFRNKYSPTIFEGDSSYQDISDFEQTRLNYAFRLTPQISLILTPLFEIHRSNSFRGFSRDDLFINYKYNLITGSRYKTANGNTTFSPSIGFGIVQNRKYSPFYKGDNVEYKVNIKPYFTGQFGFNLNSRSTGFYMNYYYGPIAVNQMFNYTYNNYFNRSVRIMPYFQKFILRDFLKTISRANFVSDISGKSNRLNLSNQLDFYFPNTWSASILGSFAFQSTYDPELDERYKYQSTYFEVKVRKEFNLPQPRLKFYTLNIVFYKDINGNRRQEDNEPGIKNIFVSFVRNATEDIISTNYEYSGEFSTVELLSDQKGTISYHNIPEGLYTVDFYSLNEDNGIYSPETSSLNIRVNKNKTIFVPFFENNKIFGKVIMNRSKLSNLGPIDISNLKVTATDRDGRVTSTLTDKNGNFVLYVPNIDKYSVKINNIFYENFDLQQNNFEVQLNGYKQFEITFVFNEKRRRIRFSTDYELDTKMQTLGLEIVRRTNLKGSVKDATTQAAIKATVRVLDAKNNVISKTQSDVVNGEYNLSFIAGENYRIEVSADEYWFYAEKLYDRQITTFQNIQKDVLLKRITVGQIIPLSKLLFDEGKSDLKSEASAELDKLLEVLKNNPTVRITIHGHADDLEVIDVGAQIAEERAKMVARYLIANGYSRVEYVGHGNTKPVAPNDNAENRQKNRRVEVVVKSK